jgi:TatD DNase family protein
VRNLIDTHCHIFVEDFQQDLKDVVERAKRAGISNLFLPNINPDTIDPMLEICDMYPGFCFPMIGLHPTDLSDNYHLQLEIIKRKLDDDFSQSGAHRFTGIGETGLDLYWDSTRLSDQIDAFETQIKWALYYDLPLIIHSRSAFLELCGVMDKYRNTNLRGIFHCFSGSEEETKRLLEYRGFLFGIGGTLTYKKSSLTDSLKLIPLERIVLETDSPFLPPVPYRGKRNEPSFIVEVVKKLSGIYGCSEDIIADITSRSASKLFGLDRILSTDCRL